MTILNASHVHVDIKAYLSEKGIFADPLIEEKYLATRKPKQGRQTWADLKANRAYFLPDEEEKAALVNAQTNATLDTMEGVAGPAPEPTAFASQPDMPGLPDWKVPPNAGTDTTDLVEQDPDAEVLPEQESSPIIPLPEPVVPYQGLSQVDAHAVEMALKSRETWLYRAAEKMRMDYEIAGFPLPEKFRISCGWPKGGKGGRGKTIGQCWPASASESEHREIFVSPELDKPVDVLVCLRHELAHAALPEGEGHKGNFIVLCKALGFTKPWTTTPMTDVLKVRMELLAEGLGAYPHAKLSSKTVKKQTTRMLLAVCGPAKDGSGPGCGAKWRASEGVMAKYEPNYPKCPCGGEISPDNVEGNE